MYQRILFFITIYCFRVFLQSECYQLESGHDLDLEMAWQRMVAYSPSIEIAEGEVNIREADKKQVSLRPNPLADIEIENIWGSGFYHGWDAAQVTYSLWQTIELGGKRQARRNFASSRTGVAYWEAQVIKQRLRYELATVFIETYTAQEKLKFEQEKFNIAVKILEIIEAQVAAGKVSPIQIKRAQITVKSAQVSVREAISQFIQAKKKLSSMWGESCPDFETVIFNFFEYSRPFCLCDIAPGLFNTPDFAKSGQEIFAASQDFKLQKANRIPDLILRAGCRTHQETNDYSIVFEAQLPIPIFNQNQGNIEKARLEINQSISRRDEIIRNLREKIAVTHEQLVAAFDKAELIQHGVLAEAEETFYFTQEGYQKGKFQYLDLLDAQKTLFEIQEQLIDVLSIYHLKKAEMERWIGINH